MKYCILLLSVVLLNATITITPVEDDAPRPGQIKAKPAILPAILPEETEKKVTEVQTSPTSAIQILPDVQNNLSINILTQDPFPQPVFHETDLIGNHLEPIFPTVITSNISQTDYYYPYNGYTQNKQHSRHKGHKRQHGYKRQHGNKKGDIHHKDKLNQTLYQSSDIYRHDNNGYILSVSAIALIVISSIVIILAICLFIMKRHKKMQQRRKLSAARNLQLNRQQYATQLYQTPQRLNSQIRLHEKQICRLNKILRDQQQRLISRQVQNNVYQHNFNYYPPVAHSRQQIIRPVYNPMNDDSNIPIGRPLSRGEFVNQRF